MARGERRQRIYDHRLRELVRRTGDVSIATDLGVPRSTATGWLGGKAQPVVSVDVLAMSAVELQAEVVKLRRRAQTLSAVVRLLMTLLRVSGFQLERAPVSNPRTRVILIHAAERARAVLPKKAVLRILGLSASRYGVWQRLRHGCDVEDQASCLRSTLNRLTAEEVATIKGMATDEHFRHVPTGRLAVLAQRLGKVFASSSTSRTSSTAPDRCSLPMTPTTRVIIVTGPTPSSGAGGHGARLPRPVSLTGSTSRICSCGMPNGI